MTDSGMKSHLSGLIFAILKGAVGNDISIGQRLFQKYRIEVAAAEKNLLQPSLLRTIGQ